MKIIKAKYYLKLSTDSNLFYWKKQNNVILKLKFLSVL